MISLYYKTNERRVICMEACFSMGYKIKLKKVTILDFCLIILRGKIRTATNLNCNIYI